MFRRSVNQEMHGDPRDNYSGPFRQVCERWTLSGLASSPDRSVHFTVFSPSLNHGARPL